MAALPYARTWYEDAAHPRPVRAALSGPVDCDVCVVGAGIAGSSAALHLAERGYRVVLLEDQRVGWGASGRSGAQVLPGVAAGHAKVRRLIGAEGARAVWDVSVEGVRLLRELIERLHIDCDFRAGAMTVAIKPRHDVELREHLEELHTELGYDGARYMPREEVRTVLDTDRYISAVYDPHAGHIHPLNYTFGLAAAAEHAGVRIFEHTRALSFEKGATVRVRAPGGEVRARYLVLCGNVYLGDTAPALASKIMTAGTCIVATEPLGPARASRLISNDAAVCDMNWVLDYFRRSADHRLLFGGRVTYAGFDPDRIAAATRARMMQVFPQLADVKIDYAWGGNVDITVNRAPHFGRLSPNIYFLQGFSGHGIALTGVAGKIVAEAVAGHAERFDVFARIPHADFPGGPHLRRPLLVLAMMYFRIKDLL